MIMILLFVGLMAPLTARAMEPARQNPVAYFGNKDWAGLSLVTQRQKIDKFLRMSGHGWTWLDMAGHLSGFGYRGEGGARRTYLPPRSPRRGGKGHRCRLKFMQLARFVRRTTTAQTEAAKKCPTRLLRSWRR